DCEHVLAFDDDLPTTIQTDVEDDRRSDEQVTVGLEDVTQRAKFDLAARSRGDGSICRIKRPVRPRRRRARTQTDNPESNQSLLHRPYVSPQCTPIASPLRSLMACRFSECRLKADRDRETCRPARSRRRGERRSWAPHSWL